VTVDKKICQPIHYGVLFSKWSLCIFEVRKNHGSSTQTPPLFLNLQKRVIFHDLVTRNVCVCTWIPSLRSNGILTSFIERQNNNNRHHEKVIIISTMMMLLRHHTMNGWHPKRNTRKYMGQWTKIQSDPG
jgi:hypothetical protein